MIVPQVNIFAVRNLNFKNDYKSRQRQVNFKQINQDTFSFSGRRREFKTDISPETARVIATKLSNSTSGLRSTYGDELFNEKTTALLTQAIAAKILDGEHNDLVIVGGDMRHASKIIVPQIAKQMKNNGFNVLYVERPVATPLLALAAKENNADVTFLMTASHNPWEHGGYNLLTKNAAVADNRFTEPIINKAVLLAEGKPVVTKTGKIGQIINYDPYDLYKEYLDTKEINGQKIIDFDAIKNMNVDILYDDFGGTGSYYLPRLLEDHGIEIAKSMRTHTEGPEPNAKNMVTLANEVKNYPSTLKIGLANDGDSDRFGIVDEQGNFIHANDVLLLMAYHLHKNKGYDKGAIIRSCATSSQIDLFAKNHGLNVVVTPVGFKYIGEELINLENSGNMAILGGEESGGLTIGGHIPEKDGFVAVLGIAELMAKEGKPLSQLLREIKADLGRDVKNHVANYSTPNKQAFLNEFKEYYNAITLGNLKELFGMPIDVDRTISEFESINKFKKGGDGIKIYFDNGSSLLVRLSGTEDKARVFKEIYSQTPQEAENTLNLINEGMQAIIEKYNALLI